MSNTPKRYSIDLTFGEVRDLLDELERVYTSSNYEIERVLTETPEELGDKSWYISSAKSNADKRAKLARLITTISGDPYGDADEIGKVEAAVQRYNDWKAVQAAQAELTEVTS